MIVGGEGEGEEGNTTQQVIVGGEGESEEGNITQQVIVGGEGEGEEGNTTQQVIVGGEGEGEEGNTTQQVIVGGEGEGEEGNTTQQVINESPYTLHHLSENGPNIALETGWSVKACKATCSFPYSLVQKTYSFPSLFFPGAFEMQEFGLLERGHH